MRSSGAAMYSRETRVLLRHYLEQGVGKTELARRFGVSRRTVYHWIETEQLDRDLDDAAVTYAPRPPVTRKLDPYRGIIQERLRTYPRLTAERIYEEIRAAGYDGGYTQIKEYVRQIRPQPVEEAVRRFETPPVARQSTWQARQSGWQFSEGVVFVPFG